MPEGQVLLDGLVALLDLEQPAVDHFLGRSPDIELQRVFGGQVAAQALVAAGRTVPEQRAVHSLHSYFIRPGDPTVPIGYQVERVRDGRSFSTRRVVAAQHGKTIFTLSASFQLPELGLEHELDAPPAPLPDTLPTVAERVGASRNASPIARMPLPLDIRYVDPPSWETHGEQRGPEANRLWMRAAGRLPDQPLTQVCVLTFASDLMLLDSVLARHGMAWGLDPISGASLDHAMWFHRPFRADDWLLYVTASPSASGGRGLAVGSFYDVHGHLVASVAQEGLLRVAR